MVPRSTTYAQLIESISQVIFIDVSEFNFETKGIIIDRLSVWSKLIVRMIE